ncbi:MAG: MFS transporter [Chloroflexi bacterium]|nr:MFS transporter [Chloroflexota bacterium]
MTAAGLLILTSGFILMTLACVSVVRRRILDYKYLAFSAVAIGMFASVMDHGSVNVALPTIAGHFQSDFTSVQWVTIGYALTISALLLPMGRLSDLLGRKKVYIIGSLVFILGAAVAGSSSNLTILIAARIFQGCGAAMTQGTGMAIVIAAFPESERGKAIGLIMTMVGTGAIAGPAIGGLLVDALGWRSVFLANIPLTLLGVAACMAILVERHDAQPTQDGQERKFDWLGAALSTGALITLLLALTNGPRSGWTSPLILVEIQSFVVLLGTFIWWELRTTGPLLDLRLFQRNVFALGVSAHFLLFLGSSAALFLTPFYLQVVLGYTPRETGLILVPNAVCMALLGPLSGHLSDRFGWRRFTVGGLVLSTTGLFLLSRLTEGSSLAHVMLALMLQSSGMGVFYSPSSSSILSTVGKEGYGVIVGFLNLIRNAANVTSVAMAAAIVTATMGTMGFEPSLEAVRGGSGAGVTYAFTLGLRHAYVTMMGLLLVAMAVSVLQVSPEPSPRAGQLEETPTS